MKMESFVEFVQEIKVDTDNVALNRNMYQLMMGEVVVKEEDISIEDNIRLETSDDQYNDDELRRKIPQSTPMNNLNANNSKPQWINQRQPMLRAIKHRRLSRIEKPNNLAYHRHFNYRPIVEEVLPELANQHPFTVSDNNIGEQSVLSIHSDIEETEFRQTVNPHASNAMSYTSANETPHTSANPLDVAFQESTIGSMAVGSQFSEAGRVDTVSEFELAMPEILQPFEALDMAVVQFEENIAEIPVVVNVQQIQEAAEAETRQLVEMQPVENRCGPCEHTFKTARNFEKHLQSKKHSQKMARLNKQNVN